MKIHRSIGKPIRSEATFEEKWKGEDRGLITCWEVGRKLQKTKPDIAKRAKNNELPMLNWKGGVTEGLALTKKYGSLNYLAQWQGLRGEDLDIDTSQDVVLRCSATNVQVVFTEDISKLSQSETSKH